MSTNIKQSGLKQRLSEGKFTITAEVVPPLTSDAAALLARAAALKGHVTAVNVTDGASAKTTMCSLAAASILASNGIEPVLQLTCRDRNRISLAADLVGAGALGIRNLLPLFGDDPARGDEPEAKAVHDLNTMGLIKLARSIRDGALPSGRAVESPPAFHIGAADVLSDAPKARPGSSLADKLEAGAEFVQTQYCFDLDLVRRYVDRLDGEGVLGKLKILIGIGPLASAKSARWMRENLFGTTIPDAIVSRIADSKDEAQAGRAVCMDLMQALHDLDGVAGVHIMAPRHDAAFIAAMISDSGLGP